MDTFKAELDPLGETQTYHCRMKFDFDFNGRPEAIVIPERLKDHGKYVSKTASNSEYLKRESTEKAGGDKIIAHCLNDPSVPRESFSDIDAAFKYIHEPQNATRRWKLEVQSTLKSSSASGGDNNPLIALKTMPFYCFHKPRYGRCYEIRVGRPFSELVPSMWSPVEVLYTNCGAKTAKSFDFAHVWTSLWHQIEPIMLNYANMVVNVCAATPTSSDPPTSPPRLPRFGNLIEIALPHLKESFYVYRFVDNGCGTSRSMLKNLRQAFEQDPHNHVQPISERILAIITIKPKSMADDRIVFLVSTKDMQHLKDDSLYAPMCKGRLFEEVEKKREEVFQQESGSEALYRIVYEAPKEEDDDEDDGSVVLPASYIPTTYLTTTSTTKSMKKGDSESDEEVSTSSDSVYSTESDDYDQTDDTSDDEDDIDPTFQVLLDNLMSGSRLPIPDFDADPTPPRKYANGKLAEDVPKHNKSDDYLMNEIYSTEDRKTIIGYVLSDASVGEIEIVLAKQ